MWVITLKYKESCIVGKKKMKEVNFNFPTEEKAIEFMNGVGLPKDRIVKKQIKTLEDC